MRKSGPATPSIHVTDGSELEIAIQVVVIVGKLCSQEFGLVVLIAVWQSHRPPIFARSYGTFSASGVERWVGVKPKLEWPEILHALFL